MLSVPEWMGPQGSYVYLALAEVSVSSPQFKGRWILHIDADEGAGLCELVNRWTVPWEVVPPPSFSRNYTNGSQGCGHHIHHGLLGHCFCIGDRGVLKA